MPFRYFWATLYNGILLFQKHEKQSISNAIQVEFDIHVGLEDCVDVQDTFSIVAEYFVAVVTIYYAKNCGKKHSKLNLAPMFALKCRCAKTNFDT